MEKQDLYIGDFYENGPRPEIFKGKKVLVIGHQCPASDGDRKAASKSKDELTRSIQDNNNGCIKPLCDGRAKSYPPRRNLSYIWFSNIIHYPLTTSLMSEEWVILYKSISFFNFIQTPCFNANRMGDNPQSECEFAMMALREYVDECKPDRIIVWGNETYRTILNDACSVSEDKLSCVLNINDREYKFLQIHHPQGANKELEHKRICDFME